MNARAFFDLVANMRAAQIGFFKSQKGSQETGLLQTEQGSGGSCGC
jgi:hypothetical protein